MKKKMKITDLKVKSFVTELEDGRENTVKAGAAPSSYENTKRIVTGGCWLSDVTGPDGGDPCTGHSGQYTCDPRTVA